MKNTPENPFIRYITKKLKWKQLYFYWYKTELLDMPKAMEAAHHFMSTLLLLIFISFLYIPK